MWFIKKQTYPWTAEPLIRHLFNPNHIRVKYGFFTGGEGQVQPCLCLSLLIGKKLNFSYFEKKTYVLFMI